MPHALRAGRARRGAGAGSLAIRRSRRWTRAISASVGGCCITCVPFRGRTGDADEVPHPIEHTFGCQGPCGGDGARWRGARPRRPPAGHLSGVRRVGPAAHLRRDRHGRRLARGRARWAPRPRRRATRRVGRRGPHRDGPPVRRPPARLRGDGRADALVGRLLVGLVRDPAPRPRRARGPRGDALPRVRDPARLGRGPRRAAARGRGRAFPRSRSNACGTTSS